MATTALCPPGPQTLLGTNSWQALLGLGLREDTDWSLPWRTHLWVLERSLQMGSGWERVRPEEGVIITLRGLSPRWAGQEEGMDWWDITETEEKEGDI